MQLKCGVCSPGNVLQSTGWPILNGTNFHFFLYHLNASIKINKLHKATSDVIPDARGCHVYQHVWSRLINITVVAKKVVL